MAGNGTIDEQRMRPSVRPLVKLALVEARNRGADAVEAEHLMLALLFDRHNPAALALGEAGLDYAAFDRAIAAERERGLRTAGVAPVPPERLRATARDPRTRWAASAREALARGHRLSTTQLHHTMRHADVAVGILTAEIGTVPRALAVAGFDRQALLAVVRGSAL